MVRARAQDRAFALMFGNSAPRALPPACYAVWLSRDAIAMAFIFTMPPYIIGTLRALFGSSGERTAAPTSTAARAADDERWRVRAQLATPVASQFVTTPLHLLGLDIYNRPGPGVSARARAQFLAREMPTTLAARVVRIFPAFSVGGVLNLKLRKQAHEVGAARGG